MGRSAKALRLAAVTLMAVLELSLIAANFLGDCDITWEPQNAKMDEGGNHLTLSLVSNSSGIHTICVHLLILVYQHQSLSVIKKCRLVDLLYT